MKRCNQCVFKPSLPSEIQIGDWWIFPRSVVLVSDFGFFIPYGFSFRLNFVDFEKKRRTQQGSEYAHEMRLL